MDESNLDPKPKPKPSSPRTEPSVEPKPDPTASLGPEPDDGPDFDEEDDLSDVIEITADDLEGAIAHHEDYQAINPNALLPSAWISSPAQVGLMAEGIRLLREASTEAKRHQEQIAWVRLLALPKSRILLVAPSVRGDNEAVEAKRIGRGPLRFNAASVLRPASMHIQKGFRERFRVKLVKESPLGPAIAIIMRKPVESRAKKKRGQSKNQPPTGSGGTTGE